MSMDLAAVKTASSLKLGRLALLAKNHSPEILTGVGIIGLGVSAVMIAKATIKAVPLMEEHHDNRVLIKHAGLEPKAQQKAIVANVANSGIKLAKVYGPAVTTGLASVACLLGAQGIMKKRNAAVAAAYKTLEESFTNYRDRVQEELGEDQERDIFEGLVEKEVIDEDGNKTIVKAIDPNKRSGYAKIFDELNVNWSKNRETNLTFLLAQQNFANDRLHNRGYVFLNEVYRALGLPDTAAGQQVGWYLNSENGDNFIDFGIFDVNNEKAREFVNGYEDGIVLDFNVDGLISDLLQ